MGTLNIRAISVDEDGKWSSSGNRYESLVEIVRPLFISSITYDYVGHEVIVEIDAEDEARLNLSSTISNGIQGYEFHLDPDNPNLFTSYVDYSNSLKLYGDAEVTVTDQYANADVESTKVQHESVGIIDNRIYAYFEKAQTSTWEDVLLIVTTGKLSHPFQFILGVGLVLDEDAQYVAKSFNIGVPGAEFDYPDGIWAGVDPFTFILAPDGLIGTGANPEDSLGTKGRFDFNVSPLAGHDIQGASGDLFNIKVKYSEPGVKTLTFQQFNGVNRTYFSAEEESQNEDRFWEDCSNWHPGLQTSIIVE